MVNLIENKQKNIQRKKIFIIGSCVTRDAFELGNIQNKFEIVDYTARTSFASSFSRYPIDIESVDDKIQSSFQKRMVITDLHKLLVNNLLHTDFDYLIVDLIDERFDIFFTKNEQVFTCSSELVDNVDINIEGKRISILDKTYFNLWCDGWTKFIKIAEIYNFKDKIILNKVFWTNETNEGGYVVQENRQEYIYKNNLWLSKLYDFIDGYAGGITTFSYDSSLFIADTKHKWGMQPYHYDASFYFEFITKLLNINCNIIVLDSENNNFLTNLSIDNMYSDTSVVTLYRQNVELDQILLVSIDIASNAKSTKKDLLYTIDYNGQVDDALLLKMGYIKSSLVGYYKYIPVFPNKAYTITIEILFPAKVSEVNFGIKYFFPKGNSLLLDAEYSWLDK